MKETPQDYNLGVKYILSILRKLRLSYIICTLFVLIDSVNMVVKDPVWYITLWGILMTCGWGYLVYNTHTDILQWEAILATEEAKLEKEDEPNQDAA